MDGAVLFGVILAGILGLIIYLWKRSHGHKPVARAVSYRCVGVEALDPHAACGVVRAMAGQRFLAGQAPQIPVPGCSAPRCMCKFVHFDDRRSGDRRSSRGQAVRSLKTLDWLERRTAPGRRKSDRAAPLDDDAMRAAIAAKRRRGR